MILCVAFQSQYSVVSVAEKFSKKLSIPSLLLPLGIVFLRSRITLFNYVLYVCKSLSSLSSKGIKGEDDEEELADEEIDQQIQNLKMKKQGVQMEFQDRR